MAILAYKPANIRCIFVSLVASLVTALGILVFGAAPIAVLGVMLWLGVFFCSHPLLLVLLWPATLLYQVIFPDEFLGQLSSSFTNLPILFQPTDIPYFFTLVYLIITAVRRPQEIVRALKENPFLSLFLAIVVASTIMYTPLYGKMAIGEARKFYFYFFFPLLTMLSVKKPRDIRGLISAIFVVATCISVIGYVRFIMNPSSIRVVSAEGSLILLFTIFSILAIHINGMAIVNRAIDTVAVGMFLLNIIGSQHRSVFLGCSFGLLLMFWLYRKKTTFLIKALIASIALPTVMAVVLGSAPKFNESFMNRLTGIIKPQLDPTGSWRIAAWHKLLDMASVEELVYGKGLGSYYSWFYRGEENKNIQPHNAYVQLILKFGVLGLIVYGMLVLRFFRKVLAVRKKLPPGVMQAYVEMSILSFGSAHAYMLGYGFSMIVLIFYAIGISTTKLLMDLQSSSRTIAEFKDPARMTAGGIVGLPA